MQDSVARKPDLPDVATGAQVLTFVLGDVAYGFDILTVQEIRGWSAVTRILHSPPHVLGVLNLRGQVVPIVDLRRRFDLPRVQFTPLTVIIVLSVNRADGRRDVGVVVDGVSDVIAVDPASVRPPPDVGDATRTACIHGLITLGDRMIVLLDIDRLMGNDAGVISAPALRKPLVYRS